jgi:hypothetical protein
MMRGFTIERMHDDVERCYCEHRDSVSMPRETDDGGLLDCYPFPPPSPGPSARHVGETRNFHKQATHYPSNDRGFATESSETTPTEPSFRAVVRCLAAWAQRLPTFATKL